MTKDYKSYKKEFKKVIEDSDSSSDSDSCDCDGCCSYCCFEPDHWHD